ncbi:GNAT family N-acetyltransferase [Flavobacterium selenitireducens]|uniref:GNAT family N-acetyltransferase n=1 Tax=Flavobacterium selenitireducens TaxID=2722704 RepID=UPI00168AA3ED|nr:GNAT family N-acetyltransferase [Flavobacterium selenitireducens]MBD3581388.1 GNAT family N-acetyltransferase [Flavobacterium selenitireducens]
MEILLRKAGPTDYPFLAETIINAEKSGGQTLTYTTIFGIAEEKAKDYIIQMLDEEIEHCEFSAEAFLIAESDGKAVGAVCCWIEAADGIASSILKGNLLRHTLPKDNFEKAIRLGPIISELHMEYEAGSIQVGLVYVTEAARGKGLVKRLLDGKISELRTGDQHVYIQVFGNNAAAIRAYEKYGFATVAQKTAIHPEINAYMPSDTKLLMKLNTATGYEPI